MTTTEKKTPGVTLLVLVAVFFTIFLIMVWPFLIYLIMGLLLAMLSRPFYNLLLKRGFGPRTASGLALTLILLAIIVPLVSFSVTAIRQAMALAAYLADARGTEFVNSAVTSITAFKPAQWMVDSPADLEAKALELARSAGGTFSRLLLVQVEALPDLALKFGIMILTWFFLLFEGEDFLKWFMSKVPVDRCLHQLLMSSFRSTAASTVVATSAAAAAQSVVIMAGFWLLGVPGVFLAGGATFIFAWIPLVGGLTVCLAGAAYLYFKGSVLQLGLMGVVAATAVIVDHVVRPVILKGRGGMHPLLAIISIFAGIRMFGILGVIFGPIVAAMLIALLNSWQLPAGEAKK